MQVFTINTELHFDIFLGEADELEVHPKSNLWTYLDHLPEF
jgi:hypothetical protein